MQRALRSGDNDTVVPSQPRRRGDHGEVPSRCFAPGQDRSPPSPQSPQGQADPLLLEWLQRHDTDPATTATVRPVATWHTELRGSWGSGPTGMSRTAPLLPRHCPPQHLCHLPQLLSHAFTLRDLLGCATRDDLFYVGIRYPQLVLPLLAWPRWGERGGSFGRVGGDTWLGPLPPTAPHVPAGAGRRTASGQPSWSIAGPSPRRKGSNSQPQRGDVDPGHPATGAPGLPPWRLAGW